MVEIIDGKKLPVRKRPVITEVDYPDSQGYQKNNKQASIGFEPVNC